MDGEETTVASTETTTDEVAATSENTDAGVETTDVNTEEVTTESSDRPDWLPENFKTSEDLAKSYVELQTKLGDHKTTEQKAQLLDRLIENPGLLSQFNKPNQAQQPQVQFDQHGRRVVSDEDLNKFSFQDTRDLLREDMQRMLEPLREMQTGWTADKQAEGQRQQVEAIYTKYPDLKENEALEERMSSRLVTLVNSGRKLDDTTISESYEHAQESLKKELGDLRQSIKKETEEAKSKGGDVSSSGAVSDARKATTIHEAAAIAKSKMGK